MSTAVETGYTVTIPPLHTWIRPGFLRRSGELEYSGSGQAWHLSSDRLHRHRRWTYRMPGRILLATLCGRRVEIDTQEPPAILAGRFVAITAAFPRGRTCSRCLRHRRAPAA